MGALVDAALNAEVEIRELKSFIAEMLRELDRLGEYEVFSLSYYRSRCKELGIEVDR